LDWFEQLTGFTESSFEETQCQLHFEGDTLFCPGSGKLFELGRFEIVSLSDLRQRVQNPAAASAQSGLSTQISVLHADAYKLHIQSLANGAVIQAASQFNLLEMASPHVTPEDGVTRYQYDHTQGPACAMAAGPATLFRNYGILVDGQKGQTSTRQVNTLTDLSKALGVGGIQMCNGYAMISTEVLRALSQKLQMADAAQHEQFKSLLKVGVHWSTQVTAKGAAADQKVTQVFCSALPIAYNLEQSEELWEPLARLVLEACYEATLCVGILNARETGNPHVFLTRVGGGVFGNSPLWIDHAIELAIERTNLNGLNVVHVRR